MLDARQTVKQAIARGKEHILASMSNVVTASNEYVSRLGRADYADYSERVNRAFDAQRDQLAVFMQNEQDSDGTQAGGDAENRTGLIASSACKVRST